MCLCGSRLGVVARLLIHRVFSSDDPWPRGSYAPFRSSFVFWFVPPLWQGLAVYRPEQNLAVWPLQRYPDANEKVGNPHKATEGSADALKLVVEGWARPPGAESPFEARAAAYGIGQVLLHRRRLRPRAQTRPSRA